MKDLLFSLTSVLFYIFLVRNTIFWLALWQIKEYRLDRVLVHLRETNQGKNLLFAKSNLVKIAFLILYVASIFDSHFYIFYPELVFVLYLWAFVSFCLEAAGRRVKLPTFTLKVLVIALLTLSFEGFAYLIPLLDKYFWLIFLDKLLPFLIAFFIGLFSFPSDFYKDLVIDRALDKIRSKKNLLKIGITGSYGKGSTKEFVYQVLSKNFNVLATKGTLNTSVGIAMTILEGLTARKEIFVMEMGAYKVGEIREMANLFKPKIGILTAINNQHSSLFAGLSNIRRAKYELIEALPKDGLALFNGNNENTLKLFRSTKKKKILYFTDYGNTRKLKADIVATRIKVEKFEVSFDIVARGKKLGRFEVKLSGSHHIENILPAVFLGLDFKMSLGQIRAALGKIAPSKKTMEPYLAASGAILIDDTYNANPASVTAAVNYMKMYKGKKVLVLQPMIELGRSAHLEHFEVAKEIGKFCDLLILTNRNFEDSLRKGIRVSDRCQVVVKSPKTIASFIKHNMGKNDVVVFEGKEAGLSFALLESAAVYS